MTLGICATASPVLAVLTWSRRTTGQVRSTIPTTHGCSTLTMTGGTITLKTASILWFVPASLFNLFVDSVMRHLGMMNVPQKMRIEKRKSVASVSSFRPPDRGQVPVRNMKERQRCRSLFIFLVPCWCKTIDGRAESVADIPLMEVWPY